MGERVANTRRAAGTLLANAGGSTCGCGNRDDLVSKVDPDVWFHKVEPLIMTVDTDGDLVNAHADRSGDAC